MTIKEIEDALPWGLHDALLERVAIDWLAATVTLSLRVKVTERQDFDRACRIDVGGLVFCSVDPPTVDPSRGYESVPSGGLWIGAGEGAANEESAKQLPEIPDGCFLHWMFVRDWNRFIHICGRTATFTWTEPQPRRVGAPARPAPPAAVDAIGDIVNRELSAVVFVRDYVQLQLDGPTVTVLTPITVSSRGVVARSGDTGFKDLLCDQISKTIVTAEARSGEALLLTVSDGSTITISLAAVDHVGPEAVIIQRSNSQCQVL